MTQQQKTEFIDDLNSMIAELETESITNSHFELRRAIGQLKAARASVVRLEVAA
jgi:hypothetical protein